VVCRLEWGWRRGGESFLEGELRRIVPRIVEFDVEKIILFGSLASGSVHKSSDIDLIVVKRTDKGFLSRLEDFYAHLEPRVEGVGILVYTPEEFKEMKESNQFVRSALRSGRALYERQQRERGEKMVSPGAPGPG